ELDLQLLGGETDRAQHAESAGLADGDHDIAAVGKGEDRELDAKLIANGGVHAYSWGARRTGTCSSLVPTALTKPVAPNPRPATTARRGSVHQGNQTARA